MYDLIDILIALMIFNVPEIGQMYFSNEIHIDGGKLLHI